MSRKPTIIDIARALRVSTATVHRALHDHPSMTPATRDRVLRMAKRVGYRPNLAARSLSSKRTLRISVNTLKGTTSFWQEVRKGVEEERDSLAPEGVEIQYRTYPRLDGSELAAFQAALEAGVDGIIAFPGDPVALRPLLRRADGAGVPVVFVATDAPGARRLSVVSIDPVASGSLAADLMGRFLRGRGTVGVTLFDAAIDEHARKYGAFRRTLAALYPRIRVDDPIEDHDLHDVSYERCRALIARRRDLMGFYVTTEASMPVVEAVRDAGLSGELTIVATDLFPALVDELRTGAVAATIYQRPRTQGRTAFRVLHDHLADGGAPAEDVTFAPHLVMRGNLEFFLGRGRPPRRPRPAPGRAPARA
jgi:LacI family transcriptional regulator